MHDFCYDSSPLSENASSDYELSLNHLHSMCKRVVFVRLVFIISSALTKRIDLFRWMALATPIRDAMPY